MGDLGHVAPQAVDAGARRDAAVDSGLGTSAGTALGQRRGHQRRLGAPDGRHLGRGLARALAERQQVVVTAVEAGQRHGAGRRQDRQDQRRRGDRPQHYFDQPPTTSRHHPPPVEPVPRGTLPADRRPARRLPSDGGALEVAGPDDLLQRRDVSFERRAADVGQTRAHASATIAHRTVDAHVSGLLERRELLRERRVGEVELVAQERELGPVGGCEQRDERQPGAGMDQLVEPAARSRCVGLRGPTPHPGEQLRPAEHDDHRDEHARDRDRMACSVR